MDHLIGAIEQREREGEAELLGGLHADDQLDSRGLPSARDRRSGPYGMIVTCTAVPLKNRECRRLHRPVAGFCFRFSDYHKPNAVALAVAEGGKMGRLAHNSFALARCGAGRPSSV